MSENIIKKAKEERWIDYYPHAGKRIGAYSSGCYDTRPYVLMNFIGDYNYCVLPQELYEEIKTSLPYNVGVYVPSGESWHPLKCVKKAQRSTRTKSVSEMLLMMFRSSNRELLKIRKDG